MPVGVSPIRPRDDAGRTNAWLGLRITNRHGSVEKRYRSVTARLNLRRRNDVRRTVTNGWNYGINVALVCNLRDGMRQRVVGKPDLHPVSAGVGRRCRPARRLHLKKACARIVCIPLRDGIAGELRM